MFIMWEVRVQVGKGLILVFMDYLAQDMHKAFVGHNQFVHGKNLEAMDEMISIWIEKYIRNAGSSLDVVRFL